MPDLLDRLKTSLADRYAIQEEIGAGGMATVYLAEDLKHHRKVAVKVLRPELAAVLGPERFLREIEIAAQLTHPHILPLHDSGEAEGFLYYVMPYIEGESLRDLLIREKQLSIEQALHITTTVGKALDHAHRHGVIHRDIKPENILLHEGEPFVADFGIALAVTEAGGNRLTETGLSLGTPQYMSPEQATGERQVDSQTDIYSLGAVLYEMLAGDPPHTASTTQAVIARLLTEKPTPLRVIRDAVPEHVEAAVTKALAKLPVDRLATAEQLIEALGADRVSGVSMPGTVPSVGPAAGAWRRLRSRRHAIAMLGIGVVVVAIASWWLFDVVDRKDAAAWARLEAIPEIARLADEGKWEDAFALARDAEAAIGSDSALASLWPLFSETLSIASEPRGARVYRRAYAAPDTASEYLGTAPLENVRFPRGRSRLRLELDGYHTLDLAPAAAALTAGQPFRLDTEETLPADMVRVRGATYRPGIGRLRHLERIELGDYLIDRYEVTNRQFKLFVDAGGYEKREYWEHPFVKDGRTISWEETMAEFTDRTGRPGPSTWEAGSYPAGRGDHPATGVSWHEAAAFARFVGKELPTVYHWARAAAPEASAWLLPVSNLDGEDLAAVGEYRGIGPFGTFDMAGNAREWCLNRSGDERYILGGGWTDPLFRFNEAQALPPFDRSPANGFRLATYLDDREIVALASRPVDLPSPSYLTAEPVSDRVFEVFERQYAYDPAPLNATTEATDTTAGWIRQRITFDAAYGSERVIAYVYLPATGRPPFQTVLYVPSGTAFAVRSFEQYGTRNFDFIINSGRAFVFPVYKGMLERGGGVLGPRIVSLAYSLRQTNFLKEYLVQLVKDLRRSIDYLETRTDLDTETLAFYGWSGGGILGPLMLAVEPRLKVAVLYVAGFAVTGALPEVDPFHYTPRVSIPVLMINSRYDNVVPVETAQLPMYRLLGTPPEHKRHVLYDGGHYVPRADLIRETLDWLDRYLGPVQ